MKYLIDCLRVSFGGSVKLLAPSVFSRHDCPRRSYLASVPLYPVESSPVLCSLRPHRDKLSQMHPIGAWLSILLISR